MASVRAATMHDVPRCVDLLALLFSQEREFRPDPVLQRRGLEMILENPRTGILFVYDADGVAQGMVTLLFSVSTALGSRVALLEDMIVSPDLRGKGIGTILVRHATEYVAARGFGRITLLTDGDNDGAHRFYERCGFSRSDMVVFRRPVGT
jgi:GNAT superfamily N-acetyltransferase